MIKRQGGFTVLELIIGIAVLSIISAFVVEFFVFTVNQTVNATFRGTLEEELRRTMDTINNDVKSATQIKTTNEYASTVLVPAISPGNYTTGSQTLVLAVQAKDITADNKLIDTPAPEYNEVIYYVSGGNLHRVVLKPAIPNPLNSGAEKKATVVSNLDLTSPTIFTFDVAAPNTNRVGSDLTLKKNLGSRSISVHQTAEAKLRNK